MPSMLAAKRFLGRHAVGLGAAGLGAAGAVAGGLGENGNAGKAFGLGLAGAATGAIVGGLGKTVALGKRIQKNPEALKRLVRRNISKHASLKDDIYGFGKDTPGRPHTPSRVYNTVKDVFSLGLNKVIENRALQGRKNIDLNPKWLSPSEKDILKKITKEDNGKTYPVARLVTSPAFAAVAPATSAAAFGGALAATNPAVRASLLKKGLPPALAATLEDPAVRASLLKKRLPLALAATLAYPAFSFLSRESRARALKARAEAGKGSFYTRENKILESLR